MIVLFDVFGVIAKPQDQDIVPASAEFFGKAEAATRKSYWDNRVDYDRGLLSDSQYWNQISHDLKLGDISDDEVRYLTRLDLESWSAIDSKIFPIFRELKESGVKLAVLSNAPKCQANIIRDLLRNEKFEEFFFSCDLGLAKPEKQLYETVIARLGVDPGSILLIDDNPTNTMSARQLGIQTIDYTDPESLVQALINCNVISDKTKDSACIRECDSRDRGARLYYSTDELRIDHASGVWVWDQYGNRYLDCSAGTFNLSLGYQHPEIVKTIQMQARELIHVTSSMQTDIVDEFVRAVGRIAPWEGALIHPKVSSGSMANEGAIKIAQRVSGKSEIASLYRAHLGQSLAMTSLSGNSFRRQNLPNLPYMGFQIAEPYCNRCSKDHPPTECIDRSIRQLEEQLEFGSRGDLAAVIVEPISGNGGNVVYPDEFFVKLRQLVDYHGAKLIFDEIQTGIGRTGTMLAADQIDTKPDILTLAKGLGGSGAQVATIITRPVCAGLPGAEHSFTYGSNLLALAVGIKTIEIVSDPSFLAHVRLVGEYLLKRFEEIQQQFSKCISDVRGKGLMIGIEFNAGDPVKSVALVNHLAHVAPKYGLLMRTSRYGRGDVLKIRPALTISIAEAKYICDQIQIMLRKECM